jgi:transposase-like protein
MSKTGRLYPPEFKEEAVRLVQSSDEKYPVSKIARDLSVSTETLRKWVKTKPRSTPEIGRGLPARRKRSCVVFVERSRSCEKNERS